MALVLAVGCGDDGSDTDTDDGSESDATAATTSNPTTTTNPTANPTANPTTTDTTTGDETGDTSTGGTEDTGAPAVDYMADIQPIWDTKCVAGCHIETGIAQAQGPILTEEKSYAAIVDVASPTVAGIVQVKPGDVDGSYLWHKINGTQANVGGLGSPMPLGGMLSEDEIATIEAWISAGAKP